ncbi:PTS sugar transporter subunit IIB [Lacticaseibacillus baoqingensis]|uniref:PTS sugar transporter subunit IIB n=1 Tax=Lacticaseibacillus baoqingensis TaxID=2486013 RepID=A0ABW4E975_9LACO
MIKLVRVDHRLIHGQVALSWTNSIGADCILVADDGVIEDPLQKATLKMAAPHNIKAVIKSVDDSIEAINNGKTENYKLFIVVGSVDSAYRLISGISGVERLNLGGTKVREGTHKISKAINLTADEEAQLRLLKDAGVKIEIQQVPTDAVSEF